MLRYRAPSSVQHGHRWPALAVLAVVALGAAFLFFDFSSDPPAKPPEPVVGAGAAALTPPKPAAVPVNRSSDVPDGFRGEVHPALHGKTRLEVTAHWTALETGQLALEVPDAIKAWYTGLKPILPRTTYTERDFSAFLPQTFGEVGQVWALDADRVMSFLRQFQPNASSHLVATGRRAGPDGAFAVLRAASPTHAEIDFRIHAEFYITPNVGGNLQHVAAWFTPAYFHGRVLVNKAAGTVEHFQLALPTEKALNAFLTVNPSALGIPKLGHDIVRVNRMELTGGDPKLADDATWSQSIAPNEARRRLARVFYKFEEIDWVPYDQAAARARDTNRPLFAIVSWGATDDQSC